MSHTKHKRLPENPNIKQYWARQYNGYDLMLGIGPFVEQNLAKLDRVIAGARKQSSKLYAVRIDLGFPQNYELSGLGDFSNESIQRFFKFLSKRLESYFREGQRFEIRRHPHKFLNIWSREYDEGHTRPHFHVLLFLNGQAFRSIGDIDGGAESLYRMVEESWLSALRCQGVGLDKQVHFCSKGQYWLNREDDAGFNALFQRTSYMAKVRDKDFSDGYHRFGGSRV